MSERTVSRWRQPWIATALLVLVVIVYTLGIVIGLARPPDVDQLSLYDIAWGTALSLPFPIVGLIIARKVPTNPIGWLFLVGPLLAMAGIMSAEIVNRLQEAAPALVPFVGDTLFFTGIGLMAGLFLLLFPSGHPPSPRWRIVVVMVFAGVVVNAIWSMGRGCINWVVAWREGREAFPTCVEPVADWFVRFDNPFGSVGSAGWWDLIGVAGSTLVVVGGLAGAASLFVRRRSAGVIERAQLRWLLVVVLVVAPMFVVLIGLELIAGVESQWISDLTFGVAMIGIPVAVGLGITRYRLYEIDHIVSRTATYGVVALVLAALYALVVTLPTIMLGSEGGSPIVVAATTLLLFALFSPLRRRVQRHLDRRFDRARYDARVVAEGFGARVRDLTERGLIERELATATSRILLPAHVSMWLRNPES